MKLKDIIGLISALVLAVAVAFLTRYFLTKGEIVKKAPVVQEQNLDITKILVAGRTLSAGDVIKPGDLIWLEWPKKAVQTNYITPNVINPQDLLGAIVLNHVSLKAPINLTDLAKAGDKGILAAIIAPGMHAISIDVTAQSASSGLIFPGDVVDIILSKSVTTSGGTGVISKTIVRNIKVLAIDVETASAREKPKVTPRVATLEVTEVQAETITAAAKDGTLSLSLRSLKKGSGTSEPADAEQTGEKEKNVVVIRGKERSEIQVRE